MADYTGMSTTRPRTTAGDFFLHLGVVATLYFAAGNLISLLFDIINIAFPDRLSRVTDFYSSGIRFALASLIIIFPLYLYLNRYLARDMDRSPEKRDLGIRKWLFYFTLFLAGAIVAGDLVAVLNTFLRGEITVRFILKALTVLLVAGSVFWYYLKELRSATPGSLTRVWNIGSGVVVLAAVIGGFMVSGSPMRARDLRFDEQRVGDLQNIQWQVVNYWQTKGKLPASLAELKDPIGGYEAPRDPLTDAAYEYSVKGERVFSLCATFALPTRTDAFGKSISESYYGPSTGDNWQHEEGRTCFDRTIDPERYPPRTSEPVPVKPIPAPR
ncbi:MAG: hypothetical protein FJY98_03170 [Candidatus Liptonbacteria bacterium]|nr:hypothetical protein [Candidatus Liptonbacteria bacterium]